MGINIRNIVCTLVLCTTVAQAVGVAGYYTVSIPILKYKLYGKQQYEDFDDIGWLGVSLKGYHMFSQRIGIQGYGSYTSGYMEKLNYGDEYKLRRAAAGAGLLYSFYGGGFNLWSLYAETGPTLQWTEFERYNGTFSGWNYGAFIGFGVKRRVSQHVSIDFNPNYTAIFNPSAHEDEKAEHLDFVDIRLGVAFDF